MSLFTALLFFVTQFNRTYEGFSVLIINIYWYYLPEINFHFTLTNNDYVVKHSYLIVLLSWLLLTLNTLKMKAFDINFLGVEL